MIELSRDRCLQRLAEHHFGRVVVTGSGADRRPVVRPVNYAYEPNSHSIAFRCAEGSKFYELARNREACFEIDEADEDHQTGWSVIIYGMTEVVGAPAEIRRLDALGLDSWAATQSYRWIRIRARTVTGRELQPAAGAPG
jgi:nitroimidazol reductase NimA-like FMN-containing flavoprotein (pyridoxamine 5'-phosphate oxidase superfamily)